MNPSFATEDERKDKLFHYWNKHLDENQVCNCPDQYDEFYEGMAMISEISKNSISLQLDDGTKVRFIFVTPEIKANSRRLDAMYLALGKRDGKWKILDVISIGSILDISTPKAKAHLSMNPLLIQNQSDQTRH